MSSCSASVLKDRLALGRAAILPLGKAASLLPLRDSASRAAIESAGIVRLLEGKPVVVWGDVIDYVLVPVNERERQSPAPPVRLKRAKL